MTAIEQTTETERLFKDLDKPALHNLAYILRHPELWPEGFVWNFNHCSQCAMGLAHELWFKGRRWSDDNEKAPSYMARAFAMPLEEAEHIFMGNEWARRKMLFGLVNGPCPRMSTIGPEQVADEIDRYIAQRAE